MSVYRQRLELWWLWRAVHAHPMQVELVAHDVLLDADGGVQVTMHAWQWRTWDALDGWTPHASPDPGTRTIAVTWEEAAAAALAQFLDRWGRGTPGADYAASMSAWWNRWRNTGDDSPPQRVPPHPYGGPPPLSQ